MSDSPPPMHFWKRRALGATVYADFEQLALPLVVNQRVVKALAWRFWVVEIRVLVFALVLTVGWMRDSKADPPPIHQIIPPPR